MGLSTSRNAEQINQMWCSQCAQWTGCHPERPKQARTVAACELYEVQQSQVQDLQLAHDNLSNVPSQPREPTVS